ncbi:OLC1v1035790C1 [Oldenlandia corymbosa var. corymbosa]|uniref:OLC1v1035790C1 n=1 Tax=Oldenlandia corymbosa var. corymbosa TaxID=529605 RepID=A0AAV1CX02_OLDCO|nr:OLC1v1035790C1 [Oldenlandia corymbosa var. corymbosa]
MEKLTKASDPKENVEAGSAESSQYYYYSQARQLVGSASFSMVLYTAVKLKLFEIVGQFGKMTAAQIASRLPGYKNPDEGASMIDRMLLLLSNFSLFTCDVVEIQCEDGGVKDERVYRLSPIGRFFVPDEEGHTIAHLAEMMLDKVFMDSWYELGNAVLEGVAPFDRVYGMNQFEYKATDPRFNELFNKGIAGSTSTIMKHLLHEYKGFEGIQKLVDVGIEHIGGDMFDSVPGGDAIFLKSVLHDWGDDRCLKLLKNCFKVLPENGKVIVIDPIVTRKPDGSVYSKYVSQMDNLMMTVNPGGKERSESEFKALAIGAGFRALQAQLFAGYIGVLELYK